MKKNKKMKEQQSIKSLNQNQALVRSHAVKTRSLQKKDGSKKKKNIQNKNKKEKQKN